MDKRITGENEILCYCYKNVPHSLALQYAFGMGEKKKEIGYSRKRAQFRVDQRSTGEGHLGPLGRNEMRKLHIILYILSHLVILKCG